MLQSVTGKHCTWITFKQWNFEMQYNNQSIAASCSFAKDMPINYVTYNTNTAMVEAKINPMKHQLHYA
jgi:hypothetical protein